MAGALWNLRPYSAQSASLSQRTQFYALSQCIHSTRVKIADQKGVKRPLEEASAEETKKVAATQLLASNAPVTDSDIDALLPNEGYETLAKPEKNAAVTDADLDAILPDYEKKDAQPEG